MIDCGVDLDLFTPAAAATCPGRARLGRGGPGLPLRRLARRAQERRRPRRRVSQQLGRGRLAFVGDGPLRARARGPARNPRRRPRPPQPGPPLDRGLRRPLPAVGPRAVRPGRARGARDGPLGRRDHRRRARPSSSPPAAGLLVAPDRPARAPTTRSLAAGALPSPNRAGRAAAERHGSAPAGRRMADVLAGARSRRRRLTGGRAAGRRRSEPSPTTTTAYRPGPAAAALDWLLARGLAGCPRRRRRNRRPDPPARRPRPPGHRRRTGPRGCGGRSPRGSPARGSSTAAPSGLPVADASQDAVLAHSAWHWVDADRAVPEVARVLRPGGRLGVAWTRLDRDVDWVAELNAPHPARTARRPASAGAAGTPSACRPTARRSSRAEGPHEVRFTRPLHPRRSCSGWPGPTAP